MQSEDQNQPTETAPEFEPDDFAEESEFDELEADAEELEGLAEALGGINQLTELGNRATELGLIVGHGYHGGQYEILQKGEIVMMEPGAAAAFLLDLIGQVSNPPISEDAVSPNSQQGEVG